MMDILSYKCPHCGAPMSYDPEKSTFYCEYCGCSSTKEELIRFSEEQKHLQEQEEMQSQEAQNEDPQLRQATGEENLVEYVCPSCGAAIVTEPGTAATFCRFCGNPTIIRGNLTGRFAPDLVIPFKVSKKQVDGLFKKFCGSGRFTHGKFYSKESIEKITGTYVPFWLFDCDFQMGISGRGSNSTSWRSGDYIYTKTSSYSFSRVANFGFDLVPADGSSRMDDELMDSLEPYDYSFLQSFDSAYLAGFAAEKYDVEKEQTFPRAVARTSASARELIMKTVKYQKKTPQNEWKHFSKAHGKYAMLPVWMLRYRYKDKTYTFAVNGQSGKVVGTPPISKLKVALFGIGSGILFFGALLLGAAVII